MSFHLLIRFNLFYRSGQSDNTQSKDEQAKAPASDVVKTEAVSTGQGQASQKKDDYGKGVVFYLNKEGRVVGVLLWNLFNRINVARRIIAQDTKFDDLNEVAKLFDIHEQNSNN